MTNKEALEVLEQMKAQIANDRKWLALDRAIRALEEIGSRAPTVDRPQVNVIPQECIKVLAETVADVVQQIDWTALCEKVAERPHGEWIAVKYKLPDTDGEYLVSLDNGRIVTADGRAIIENHDFEPKMMAWQPLPEPYRAEVEQSEKGGSET